MKETVLQSDFPASMGAVAPRGLIQSGIASMQQATKYTEKELLRIHGVGPKALRILKEELKKQKLSLKPDTEKPKHRIFTMSVASVYPFYIAKAEKKDRTKAEVDEIITWLTGYTQKQLNVHLQAQTDFETFFAEAPKMNPKRTLITGIVCGVRVEDIADPTMQAIRYLDKLVDELARGKAMDKILRS
jgi:hypothetical protein